MKKLLIANRGEIAVRIIRSCRRLGIKTVAIYSDIDKHSLAPSLADESYCLDANVASDSYMAIDKILSIAKNANVDAIHPGYGFLSEDPGFASAVRAAGIIFVGPEAETLKLLGGKDEAKEIAQSLGIPTIPGYDGSDQSEKTLIKKAVAIGFPIMIKAAAGGGGRGMRKVLKQEDMAKALASARLEAEKFFGNGFLILEKEVINARHIEVQVLGDTKGNVIHLFERDCSLQRRYQKVIEEAPASGLTSETRGQILSAATKIAEAVSLIGAATVEFLVCDNDFYFLEVNPRLQVEHPVTEMVTGVDIVELQLLAAAGKAIPLKQKDIKLQGHAIEARVCAEIPLKNFTPTSGTIKKLYFPKATEAQSSKFRLEHGLQVGTEVGTFYDSLLLKTISSSSDRLSTLSALRDALSHIAIDGVSTNISFLIELIESLEDSPQLPDTSYIDRYLEQSRDGQKSALLVEAAACCFLLFQSQLNQGRQNSFYPRPQSSRISKHNLIAERNISLNSQTFECQHNAKAGLIQFDGLNFSALYNSKAICGSTTTFQTHNREVPLVSFEINNEPWDGFIMNHSLDSFSNLSISLVLKGHLIEVSPAYSWQTLTEDNKGEAGKLSSPLPGKVLKVLVEAGDKVQRGQTLIVVESMKTEHSLSANCDGVIESIAVAETETVATGDLLAVVNQEHSGNEFEE